MIHMRNAAIADPAVMTARRFIGLTLGAHGKLGVRSVQERGNGTGRYTAGIGQGRLHVCSQCQSSQNAIYCTVENRDALVLGQERNGEYRVGNENPD